MDKTARRWRRQHGDGEDSTEMEKTARRWRRQHGDGVNEDSTEMETLHDYVD
jgi:hypothetical protein